MYCVMRTSAPSLYNVYRRYDTTTHEAVRVDSLPTIHVYMYCTCTVKGLVRRELVKRELP